MLLQNKSNGLNCASVDRCFAGGSDSYTPKVGICPNFFYCWKKVEFRFVPIGFVPFSNMLKYIR